jgi:hypothetical protein
MSKGLHLQLRETRGQIAAAEALVAAGKHLYETHKAEEALPRLRHQHDQLEFDIALGEDAHGYLVQAIATLGSLVGGRELSLALTHAEDAMIRLRRHLGHPEESTQPELG